MSRSVKRNLSSLSFSLTKLYRRISTAKPSNLIIPLAAIAIAVFLFGGGLYDIIVQPLPAVYYNGQFLILYPTLSEQFLGDSIVSTSLYSLGVAGLLAIYQSTKHVYRPRQAYIMLIVGVILVLIAYIFLETAIQIKLGG
jgi:hypothetical protein